MWVARLSLSRQSHRRLSLWGGGEQKDGYPEGDFDYVDEDDQSDEKGKESSQTHRFWVVWAYLSCFALKGGFDESSHKKRRYMMRMRKARA